MSLFSGFLQPTSFINCSNQQLIVLHGNNSSHDLSLWKQAIVYAMPIKLLPVFVHVVHFLRHYFILTPFLQHRFMMPAHSTSQHMSGLQCFWLDLHLCLPACLIVEFACKLHAHGPKTGPELSTMNVQGHGTWYEALHHHAAKAQS